MKKITMMVLAMVAVTLVGARAYAPEVQSIWSRVVDRVVELVRPELQVVGSCPFEECIDATGGFSDSVSSYKIFALPSPIVDSVGRVEAYITGPYPSDLIDDGLQVYCRILQNGEPSGAPTEWVVHRGSGCIPIAVENNHKFICSFRTVEELLESLAHVPLPGVHRRLDCIVAKNHPEIEFTSQGRAMSLTEEDRDAVLGGPHSPSLIVNDVLRNNVADNIRCPISIGQCS